MTVLSTSQRIIFTFVTLWCSYYFVYKYVLDEKISNSSFIEYVSNQMSQNIFQSIHSLLDNKQLHNMNKSTNP